MSTKGYWMVSQYSRGAYSFPGFSFAFITNCPLCSSWPVGVAAPYHQRIPSQPLKLIVATAYCVIYETYIARERGQVVKVLDYTCMVCKVPGLKSPSYTWVRLPLCALSKALHSTCSVLQRARSAVSPVYMYFWHSCSVHVKECHRLFGKSRGSSRYCWLYFKTTLIYSRFQSMGKGDCGLFESPKLSTACLYAANTQTYVEVSTNSGRSRRRRSAESWCLI